MRTIDFNSLRHHRLQLGILNRGDPTLAKETHFSNGLSLQINKILQQAADSLNSDFAWDTICVDCRNRESLPPWTVRQITLALGDHWDGDLVFRNGERVSCSGKAVLIQAGDVFEHSSAAGERYTIFACALASPGSLAPQVRERLKILGFRPAGSPPDGGGAKTGGAASSRDQVTQEQRKDRAGTQTHVDLSLGCAFQAEVKPQDRVRLSMVSNTVMQSALDGSYGLNMRHAETHVYSGGRIAATAIAEVNTILRDALVHKGIYLCWTTLAVTSKLEAFGNIGTDARGLVACLILGVADGAWLDIEGERKSLEYTICVFDPRLSHAIHGFDGAAWVVWAYEVFEAPKLDRATSGMLKAAGFVLDDPRGLVAPIRGRFGAKQLGRADLYIGRGALSLSQPRSFWANPYRIDRDHNRASVIAQFQRLLDNGASYKERLPELHGRVLNCHCKAHQECHGDALIRAFLNFRTEACLDLYKDAPSTDAALSAARARIQSRPAASKFDGYSDRQEPTQDGPRAAPQGGPG